MSRLDSLLNNKFGARWSSGRAHLTHNQKIPGPNPGRAIRNHQVRNEVADNNSKRIEQVSCRLRISISQSVVVDSVRSNRRDSKLWSA